VRSPLARGAIALAAVAVVVVLFIVLAGGDDETAPESVTTGAQTQMRTATTETTRTAKAPAPDEIVVRDGTPVGGVKELQFDSGDRVRFVVRSDVADEIHVHGYDKSEDIPAGGSVRFSFPADIEGVFEVELEERGEQIAELRVNP
jgi:hypothetical protein